MQKAGKSKCSKIKKGENFLGEIGDLVAPTGWGSFATSAGLLELDRAESALRRRKSTKSSAKKGGMRDGDPMDEDKLIKQNNAYLINSFLRLGGYAFTSEDNTLFPKLNNFIRKRNRIQRKNYCLNSR